MRYVATKRSVFYNHTNEIFLGTQNGQYGDGSDLDVTISTPVTLTRDHYYNNLTITNSGIITTAGYRIFVAGVLTMQAGAIIERNGNNASGVTAGLALTNGVLGGGSAGGDGATFPATTGLNGTNQGEGFGGKGGNGGGTGGLAGTNSISALTGALYFGSWPTQVRGANMLANVYWFGGSGGGGGGATSTFGGGGGGGAGIIMIFARAINSATGSFVQAMGGRGGDGDDGGGGGGGGVVLVYTAGSASRINWTVDVSGGIGGNGVSSGFDGNSGPYLLIASNE